MRHVKFGKLVLHNFKCHEDEEFDFTKNELVAITGPNGRGKTTILDALSWACYDVTTTGRRGNSVIRKRSKGDTSVVLDFTIGSDQYRIENYKKSKTHGDNKILLKNGADMSGTTRSITNQIIEDLIMPKEVFQNCLLLSQYIAKSFTQMTYGGQSEIIDAIMNVGHFEIHQGAIVDEGKGFDKELVTLRASVDPTRATIEVMEKTIREYKDMKKRHKDEKKTVAIDLNKQIEDLEKERAGLPKPETDIEAVRKSLEETCDKLSVCRTEVKTLKSRKITDKEQCRRSHEKDHKAAERDLLNKYKDAFAILDTDRSASNAELTNLNSEEKAELAALDAKKARRKNEMQSKYGDKIDDLTGEKYQCESDLKVLKRDLGGVSRDLKTKRDSYREIRAAVNEGNPSCSFCEQEVKDGSLEIVAKKLLDLGEEGKQLAQQEKQMVSDQKTLEADLVEKSDELTRLRNEQTDKFTKINNGYLNDKTRIESDYSEKKRLVRVELEKISVSRTTTEAELNDEKVALEDEFMITYNKDALKIETDLNSEIEGHTDSIDQLTKSEKGLRSTIAALETSDQDRIRLSTSIENIRARKEASSTDIDGKISELTSTIKSHDTALQEKKASIEDHANQLETLERHIEILDFWKKAFASSGIKAVLLDEMVPIMNTRARELSNVTDNIRVRFDSQKSTQAGELRNKFSVDVSQTLNLTDDRADFSAGEGKLADIITLLSLRHALEVIQETSFNVYLFDEILDSLDPTNADIVIGMLRLLAEDHCVVLISHTLRERIECDKHLPM